jgi:pleiotropic regulator 1
VVLTPPPSRGRFWDYSTGYGFQNDVTRVQPGSLDAEAGIYAMAFDQTGSRLITCEADKTIKIWKEDPDATPESHPIDMTVGGDEDGERKRVCV